MITSNANNIVQVSYERRVVLCEDNIIAFCRNSLQAFITILYILQHCNIRTLGVDDDEINCSTFDICSTKFTNFLDLILHGGGNDSP